MQQNTIKNGQKFNAEYYKDEKLDDLVISRYKSGKDITTMENEMVFSLFGMKMERNGLSIITKMEN